MRKFTRQAILIMALFCSCKQNKEHIKTPFSNQPTFYLTASIDSMGDCDSTPCYYVTASLENKTLLNLPFYSWTCSWTKDFVTDNKNFDVIQNICYLNWYVKDFIPPLGKRIFQLIIRNVGKQQNDMFKIGFTFIDPGLVAEDEFLNMSKSERLKNTHWSNGISTDH